MSKSNSGMIIVTLRKISSGHKVVAVQGDSMDHLYSIARILIRSQEYNRCYAVGTDWQGNTLFNVQPEHVYQAPAPYQAPVPQPQYPQMPPHGYAAPPGYALPQYAPPAPQPGNPYGAPPPIQADPFPSPSRGSRVVPAYVEVVEDGYAPEAPVQRALPALPWKGGR